MADSKSLVLSKYLQTCKKKFKRDLVCTEDPVGLFRKIRVQYNFEFHFKNI
jgi:hypothetical protein